MSSLYKDKNAKLFSQTRNYPWAGWKKFLDTLCVESQSLKVLDIGCGNARFLSFLKSNLSNIDIKYSGIDNSQELLNIALEKHPETHFKNIDIDNECWDIKEKDYDLVVIFGVLHHLASNDIRKYCLRKARDLLVKGGRLVVTFWMFKENQNFMNKHLIKDLGDDNFILSFGNQAERFCHYSGNVEINKLINDLKMDVIEEYRSDGFENQMNQYFVLKR